jgi:hypothetical protein
LYKTEKKKKKMRSSSVHGRFGFLTVAGDVSHGFASCQNVQETGLSSTAAANQAQHFSGVDHSRNTL